MNRRILHRLRSLTWHEWGLLIEALVHLGIARAAVLSRPFNRIAPSLGEHMATADPAITEPQRAHAHQIGWIVRAVARRTPWDSNCLAQAIAAKRMLQRRGIPSTLYLGVTKGIEEPKQLEAHAWLQCGDIILTGRHGHERFKVISTFGDRD
jgi:transglutaminase superfamily protein